MTCVIGTPMVVGYHTNPSHELVEKTLTKFIDNLEALIDQYKAECGYPHLSVTILLPSHVGRIRTRITIHDPAKQIPLHLVFHVSPDTIIRVPCSPTNPTPHPHGAFH